MRTLYKILHTSGHTQWGSLEKRIFNESVWMEKNGHKIIIVAPKDTPLFLKSKAHGFKVYGVEFKRFSMIKDYRKLHRIFYNERPDIVNTHGEYDSKTGLMAAHRTGVACKVLFHHSTAHLQNAWINRILFKKTSNYIFTNSGHTTEYFKTLLNCKDHKIFTVPLGIIPPTTLLSKPEAITRLINVLNLDSQARFLGVVGNLKQNLATIELIKAFKKIEQRLPNHHLVVAGSGPKEDLVSVKKLVKKLGLDDKIHFLNSEKDTWSVLQALDCQITPVQKKKGVLIEEILQDILNAMYCSCPVVISRSKELAGIVDGTGFLFDLEDPEELADTIFQVLNHDSETQKKIQAAHDMVKKNHTIEAAGSYIIKLFRLFQVRSDGPNRDDR